MRVSFLSEAGLTHRFLCLGDCDVVNAIFKTHSHRTHYFRLA